MVNETQGKKIFRIKIDGGTPFLCSVIPFLKVPLENVLFFPLLNRLYKEVSNRDDNRHFLEKAIEALNITYDVPEQEVSRIPKTGPVVVVSNHPFGVAEGLVASCILRSVRPDVKLMANHLLKHIPDLHDMTIFVDPYKGKNSVVRNLRPVKETIQWIQRGGMVVVFPAGEVSHMNFKTGKITDPQWSHTIARIIRKTGACVLPVFFEGSNSALFQIIGLLHPRMRTVLLPRELLNKGDKTIKVRIGGLIHPDRLKTLGSDAEIMTYLRLRTYALKSREAHNNKAAGIPLLQRAHAGRIKPIALPQHGELIGREVSALLRDRILVENGEYAVMHAQGQEIPYLLREIGRLREVTFREVGEGTGRSLDIDRFDPHYTHLFAWNRERRELVGAYRLGKTDEILARMGKKGLYTSTLFHYKTTFLERIDPALELGRSFVCPEYQKNYSSLLLLWKGIGQFICKNPRYKILFGPVSITNAYHPLSRQVMVSFLKGNSSCLPEFAGLVKARRPFRMKPMEMWDEKAVNVIKDIEDISGLVSDIENDRTGIPILLKQYLRLGGKLIEFSVDPKFHNVVDGLVLVDLTRTEIRILERYMGKEGAKAFLECHGQKVYQNMMRDIA